MNQQFKTLRNLACILLGAVALYACGEDGPKPKPAKPKTEKPTLPKAPEDITKKVETPVVSTDAITGKFPGINTTKVHKIVIRMYEGHIHEPANFHYVPGPKGLNQKGLGYEQDVTLVYRNNQWEVTDGEKLFLFMAAKDYSNPSKSRPKGGNLPAEGEAIPQPVYGMWVDYYDAQNNLLNGEFAATGAYQTFFRPMQPKSISKGEELKDNAEDLLGYIYRDTDPYNKANKEGAMYIDQTDPVGLKGFFFFNKHDARFALNIELWETPKGKLTDGKRAVFYEPSEHIKSTGRPVLSVSIPTYVYMSHSSLGEFEEDINTLDDTAKATFEKLMTLLGTTWDKLYADFDRRIEADRGDGESGGQWF